MDREELAWAAGLFDGEGCIVYYKQKNKHSTPALRLAVTQSSRNDEIIPIVLLRFQKAIGNVGYIRLSPNKTGFGSKPRYDYATNKFEHVLLIVGLLWTWLSPVKREQIRVALTNYKQHYRQAKPLLVAA